MDLCGGYILAFFPTGSKKTQTTQIEHGATQTQAIQTKNVGNPNVLWVPQNRDRCAYGSPATAEPCTHIRKGPIVSFQPSTWQPSTAGWSLTPSYHPLNAVARHPPEHLGFSWNPPSHWVLRIAFHLRLKPFQFAPFIAHLLKLNANRKATITPSQYQVLPQFSRLTRIYGIDMSIVYRSKGFTIPPPSKRKH